MGLMGRLADAMGAIFLGYATLHHYHRKRGMEGLEALTEHAMLRLENEAQEALYQATDNFPGSGPVGVAAKSVMKLGCFPLGSLSRPYGEPNDILTKEVSRMLTTPSELREQLFQGNIYMAPEGDIHQVSDLIRALPVCMEADQIASLLRREKRGPTEEEKEVMIHAEALRDALIQVDVFKSIGEEAWSGDDYERPALSGTRDRLDNTEIKRFEDFMGVSVSGKEDSKVEAI